MCRLGRLDFVIIFVHIISFSLPFLQSIFEALLSFVDHLELFINYHQDKEKRNETVYTIKHTILKKRRSTDLICSLRSYILTQTRSIIYHSIENP